MNQISIQTLAPVPVWVAWQTEDRGDDKPPTKVPHAPKGGKARADDPATWGCRADAERRAAELPKPYGAGGIGIELAQLPDSTICMAGIDLDTCLDPNGTMAPWASEIVTRFASYTETSPSGTGAKVFITYAADDLPKLRAAMGAPKWGRQFKRRIATEHPPAIELYLGNRYFAVTGQKLDGAPDEFRPVPLDDLLWLIREAGPRFVGDHTAEAKQKDTEAEGLDQSRSAIAFRVGKQLRRLGHSFDEMVASLHTDSRTAEWARDKGDAAGGREFRRIWERAASAAPAVARGSIPGWLRDCQATREGEPRGNVANALLALREDARLRDLFAFDQMKLAPFLMRPVPSRTIDDAAFDPRPVRDSDITALTEFLQLEGLATIGREAVFQAMDLRATERAFHPIRDYLGGLHWDGTPRVATWMSTYLGAADNPYTRSVGEMFLISMVARIYVPGCKVDHMPIFQGLQGTLKSSACRILGGAWFDDSLPDIHSKDAAQHLRGLWLIEVAELASTSRAEADHLKAFITRSTDIYRPSYGKLDVEVPRQCTFIGSTNEAVYLRDETGGRRFWPVGVSKIDLPGLTADRDQLWAEVVHLYRAGRPWWAHREFEAKYIVPEQDSRFVADAWQERIAPYLAAAPRVTIGEVAKDALFLDIHKLGIPEQRRIRAVLHKLGWAQDPKRRGPAGERYYYPV